MRRDHGFTLIELVMTMVIFGVITAALSAGLAHIVRDFTVARGATERMFEVDAGLSLLERAMRRATSTSDVWFDAESASVKASDGAVLLTGVSEFNVEPVNPSISASSSSEGAKNALKEFNLQDTAIADTTLRLWKATVKVRFAEGFEPVEFTVTVPGGP